MAVWLFIVALFFGSSSGPQKADRDGAITHTPLDWRQVGLPGRDSQPWGNQLEAWRNKCKTTGKKAI